MDSQGVFVKVGDFIKCQGFLGEFLEKGTPEKIKNPRNGRKSGLSWASPFTMHLVCTLLITVTAPGGIPRDQGKNKHININKFGGLSRDRVGVKMLFLSFLGSPPYGGEKRIHKQIPSLGTIPQNLCLCFLLHLHILMFFRTLRELIHHCGANYSYSFCFWPK